MNITVLVSSHILDELARVATHFGFVDDGVILKEISAGELADACRRCLRVTVSDINVLSRVLDSAGMEYSVLSDSTADIFDSVSITDLTLKLSEQGCEIRSVNERDESLENYYMNLVGGGKNE